MNKLILVLAIGALCVATVRCQTTDGGTSGGKIDLPKLLKDVLNRITEITKGATGTAKALVQQVMQGLQNILDGVTGKSDKGAIESTIELVKSLVDLLKHLVFESNNAQEKAMLEDVIRLVTDDILANLGLAANLGPMVSGALFAIAKLVGTILDTVGSFLGKTAAMPIFRALDKLIQGLFPKP